MGGEREKRMAYFLNNMCKNILKISLYLWQPTIQFEAKIKLLQTSCKSIIHSIKHIIYIYAVNKYALIVYSVIGTTLSIQGDKQNKVFKNCFQTFSNLLLMCSLGKLWPTNNDMISPQFPGRVSDRKQEWLRAIQVSNQVSVLSTKHYLNSQKYDQIILQKSSKAQCSQTN